MSLTRKLKPKFKLWLEYEGRSVLGKGGAQILQEIDRYGSIIKAAKRLSLSYRFVWRYLEKIKERTGGSPVRTYRGGYGGGGGTKLTQIGRDLLTTYLRYEKEINEILIEE
jgi:molybdate transport system regulatory protein